MDGRILEDESRRAMPPAEFALEAGGGAGAEAASANPRLSTWLGLG